jgi:hypothetical protein
VNRGSERDRRDDLVVGLALGLIAAAVLATVAALRATDGSVSRAWVWIGVWGALAAVLGPLGAAVRRATPLALEAWCIPVGIALALAPLGLFARILKATTHHRPLGAVTFAIISIVVVLGAIAFSARVITELAARRNSPSFRAVRALSVIAAALLALAGCAVAFRALAGDAELRPLAIDTVLLLVAVAAVGWFRLPAARVKRVRSLVFLAWAVAVAAAIIALGRPEVAQVIAAAAPVVRLLPVPTS